MDHLTIHQLELFTRIGDTAEERSKTQRVLVDVEMFVDLSKAGKSDAVKDSVNYAHVVERIKGLADEDRVTIERFAEDVAQMILHEFDVLTIKVSIWKFPIPGLKAICATIEREKM